VTVSSCPHCGTPAYANDSRCRNCGWQLTRSTPQPSSPSRQSAPPAAMIPPRPQESVWRQANPEKAPLPSGQPVTVPGYPTYAQGQGVPYAPYPPQYQPYPPYSPYGPYPPYAYPPRPRRAPGETYALVVSWIVTVVGALSIILSLLILGITALSLSGGSNNLSTLGLAVSFGLAPLAGGITAMVLGIQGILRRPSHRFTMPSYWFLFALALLALGAGVALWNLYPSPGSALAVSPLVVMSGVLPALAILALTTQRLGDPSTRRHVLMSLAYGATLAPLLAIVLELIATLVIYLVARLRRKRLPESIWFYRALVLAAPLSVVALIAGWVTTEVGRQPWVVYHVMRTSEAVTGAGGIPVGYATLAAIYVALAGGVVWVLLRLYRTPT